MVFLRAANALQRNQIYGMYLVNVTKREHAYSESQISILPVFNGMRVQRIEYVAFR